MKKVTVKSVGEVKRLLTDGYELIYWSYWAGSPETITYTLQKTEH
jgi:hypothetical protein